MRALTVEGLRKLPDVAAFRAVTTAVPRRDRRWETLVGWLQAFLDEAEAMS